MANRAYLMNHAYDVATTSADAEESCLLGANYQVPVLWIALFEPTDLMFMPVPCTNDKGDERIELIPTLFAPASKAKSTYAARRTSLARALGPESADPIAEWEELLSTHIPAASLQVDVGELWIMYENPTDCELDLRDWLTGVVNQSGVGWANLCSQAKLDDPEVKRYGLRGFPWHSEVKWA